MKIYFATQIKPDTTQLPTLLKREGVKMLLAYFHAAGGKLGKQWRKLLK